ncbi:DNA polymerase III subunit gamma and tau [Corynebacterium sp.]|uniref:DNA polymerase III subunit gamma and tau n=1 Tax=Corynebacterium sp. TaxID=1720 RepID=UPI0026492E4A|nr:DNA polymerase III subunit gamma and tau [Corynebacterium sp.]MDN6137406.1 DNA polymerase III subunit gamma and tau [Corynebacterium sp.]MDN6737727.1 DNA polymerase III subunit gamma and tau [Corynebacterium sp.]
MALYRKYRPATFAEVVGQEQVTQPLSAALDAGRINHAYLFSGPRGCGKTSSARIMARSLNCVQGPTSQPCGQCASCISLAPGGPGNLDVTELDAASHNSVEDMRELRERAYYAPADSRYRIFIIDEAHMVTNQGFNALLKIVEEPPEHLIFIFATTEPDKVIGTIRSRTHHYPFRLLTPPAMKGLLERTVASEGVFVEDSVYPMVISAGGGSPRDTLSILDQLLAGAGPNGLTYDIARPLLGVTDETLLDDTIAALAQGDKAALFKHVDAIIEAGHEPRRFAVDLLARLRDLMILQAVPDAIAAGLVDAPVDRGQILTEQAQLFNGTQLAHYAATVNEQIGALRGATSPRLLLEILCAHLVMEPASTDVSVAGSAPAQSAPAGSGANAGTSTPTGGTPAGNSPAGTTQGGSGQGSNAPSGMAAAQQAAAAIAARRNQQREQTQPQQSQAQQSQQQPQQEQWTQQPAQPAPPQETPAEQAPAEQTPAEQTPVQQPAAQPAYDNRQSAEQGAEQSAPQERQEPQAQWAPQESAHQDSAAQKDMPQSQPAPVETFEPAPSQEAEQHQQTAQQEAAEPEQTTSEVTAHEETASEAGTPAAATSPEDVVEQLRNNWQQLRASVSKRNKIAGIMLTEARVLGLRDNTLILGHTTGALAERLNAPANNKDVVAVVAEEAGYQLAVQCIVGTDPAAAGFSAAPPKPKTWNPRAANNAARETGDDDQESESPRDYNTPASSQPADESVENQVQQPRPNNPQEPEPSQQETPHSNGAEQAASGWGTPRALGGNTGGARDAAQDSQGATQPAQQSNFAQPAQPEQSPPVMNQPPAAAPAVTQPAAAQPAASKPVASAQEESGQVDWRARIAQAKAQTQQREQELRNSDTFSDGRPLPPDPGPEAYPEYESVPPEDAYAPQSQSQRPAQNAARNQGSFGGGTAQPQANAAHNGASPSNAPQAQPPAQPQTQPQNGQQQEPVAQPQAAYSREAQENEMMEDAREQGNLDRRSATEVAMELLERELGARKL